VSHLFSIMGSYFLLCAIFYQLWWYSAHANPDSFSSKRHRFCNDTESLAVARYFRNTVNVDWSNCPKESWMIDMRNVDPEPNKVFVDIGFNKGYNYAIWASTWMPHAHVNSSLWFDLMGRVYTEPGEHRLCGHCEDCLYDKFMSQLSKHVDTSLPYDKHVVPKMYGIDINPTNIKLVNDITSIIKYEYSVDLNVKLKLAAAAKENGVITVLKCEGGIFEGCLIVKNPSDRNGVVEVPMMNLEQLIKTFDIEKNGDGVLIDILLIDTEGHDAEVLKGAYDILRQRRAVRMISFELNENCPWPLTKLETIIQDLAKMSYVCYFQGQGRLFRLTGCWTDLYEINRWSNIACVKRKDIWYSVMENHRVTYHDAIKALTKMGRLDTDQFPEKLQERFACTDYNQ
jgi:hypothetical protein